MTCSRTLAGVVLYAHTKGAANPSVRQDTWRKGMTHVMVDGWKDCVNKFKSDLSVDIVGMYRIVNNGDVRYAGDGADVVAAALNKDLGIDLPVTPPFPEVGQAIFAGNFWWTTTDWVASKRMPGLLSRYDAETWISEHNRLGRYPTVINISEWELV